MIMHKIIGILFSLFSFHSSFSQDVTALVKKVKAKLDLVNDYTATGTMKTDVAFIKAPIGNIKVYFKKPNKIKLVKDKGISIIPKGGVTFNMSTILASDQFATIDAGSTMIDGFKVKKIKLIPLNDNNDVVIATLYIDEVDVVIRKSEITTRDNGSFEMSLGYSTYVKYGLPSKVVFSFNTKDYKLPKGVTLEFDESEKPKNTDLKNKKGRVEIAYSSYIINKGVSDSIFK